MKEGIYFEITPFFGVYVPGESADTLWTLELAIGAIWTEREWKFSGPEFFLIILWRGQGGG